MYRENFLALSLAAILTPLSGWLEVPTFSRERFSCQLPPPLGSAAAHGMISKMMSGITPQPELIWASFRLFWLRVPSVY